MGLPIPLVKWYKKYKKCMWYQGVAQGELGDPLMLLGEVLKLMNTTFLYVLVNQITSAWSVLWKFGLGFIFAVISFILIGRWLVNIGAVRYDIEFNNNQNDMMKEILERLKRLELNDKK